MVQKLNDEYRVSDYVTKFLRPNDARKRSVLNVTYCWTFMRNLWTTELAVRKEGNVATFHP